VLGVLLVIVAVSLTIRGRAAALAAVGVPVGRTPLTHTLGIGLVAASDPGPRKPGMRLGSLDTDAGRVTFALKTSGLRTANTSSLFITADLRELWPPIHNSVWVTDVCGDSTTNPCPPGMGRYREAIQAVDVAVVDGHARLQPRASDAATAVRVGSRDLVIDPGPISPDPVGVAAWLAGLAVIATTIRRAARTRATASSA
jgi:hypothetical protein